MKMSTTKFAKRIGVFTAAVCFSPVLFADENITGDQIEEPHHHNDMALFTGVTNTAGTKNSREFTLKVFRSHANTSFYCWRGQAN